MGMSFEDNLISSTNRPVSRSSIVIVSEMGGLSFKFRIGQIAHSVANGSSSLQHFFERSCVTWAQWRGKRSGKLVTRFGKYSEYIARFNLALMYCVVSSVVLLRDFWF